MTDTHRAWGDLTPEEQDAILRQRDKQDAERFRWLVRGVSWDELAAGDNYPPVLATFGEYPDDTRQITDLAEARIAIDAWMKEDGSA